MTFAEIFTFIIRSAFGFGIVVALLGFIYYRNAERWRHLASVYGREWKTPLEQKRFQHGILYGKKQAFNSYNFILTIGLHQDGVAVKVFGPSSVFSDPIFVPYNEIKGWNQTWYLNAKSVELQFDKMPDLKFVMPKDQVEWMQQLSGSAINLANHQSPNNAKPVRWYAAVIVISVASLLVIPVLLYMGMPLGR